MKYVAQGFRCINGAVGLQYAPDSTCSDREGSKVTFASHRLNAMCATHEPAYYQFYYIYIHISRYISASTHVSDEPNQQTHNKHVPDPLSAVDAKARSLLLEGKQPSHPLNAHPPTSVCVTLTKSVSDARMCRIVSLQLNFEPIGRRSSCSSATWRCRHPPQSTVCVCVCVCYSAQVWVCVASACLCSARNQ